LWKYINPRQVLSGSGSSGSGNMAANDFMMEKRIGLLKEPVEFASTGVFDAVRIP